LLRALRVVGGYPVLTVGMVIVGARSALRVGAAAARNAGPSDALLSPAPATAAIAQPRHLESASWREEAREANASPAGSAGASSPAPDPPPRLGASATSACRKRPSHPAYWR
jgi:hypothetical protein